MPANDGKPLQKAAAGGAATHKGVWYQALWCVLQAAKAQVETCGSDGLQLILEPVAGDAWVVRPGHRRVVQLKTAHRGTWSLKEVVEEVLPDLYRSVRLGGTETTTYEFVTEGRIGSWEPVLSFFESLGRRCPPGASADAFNAAYEALDDHGEMHFGGSDGAFWQGGRTERRVFDRIVERLHADELATDDRTAIEQTRRKTWHLLANFRFVGDVREESVRQDLDSALLAIVEQRERLASVRDAMVGDLIKRSRQAGTAIRPAELLEAQGLRDVVPVTGHAILADRCRGQVQQCAGRLGYRAEWDVRRTRPSPAHGRSAPPPITVITGESGQGKTWRLCAEILESDLIAPVLLRSTGVLHDDLQRAADEVWRRALGHEGQVDLPGVSARRADLLKLRLSDPWMTIALDQLSGWDQANALLCEPIEDWGVRMLIACDAATAEVFERHSRQHPGRVQVLRVGLFSAQERDDYVQLRLGNAWVDVPQDVRELVRSPQLAALYCDISSEQRRWQPQDEYDLIDRYWKRLSHADNADHQRDELRLRRLVATVLAGVAYPWDEEQLEQADVDEAPPGYEHKIPHLRNFLPGLALRVTRLPVERKLNLHVAHVVHVAHKTVDVFPTFARAVYPGGSTAQAAG